MVICLNTCNTWLSVIFEKHCKKSSVNLEWHLTITTHSTTKPLATQTDIERYTVVCLEVITLENRARIAQQ